MNARLLAVVCGLAVAGWGWKCFAEPPLLPGHESDTTEQLRREVEELRQTVNALRARLDELEYQGLPQAAKLMSGGQLTEPHSEISPVGYLRFPFNIERGTSAPIWFKRSRKAR